MKHLALAVLQSTESLKKAKLQTEANFMTIPTRRLTIQLARQLVDFALVDTAAWPCQVVTFSIFYFNFLITLLFSLQKTREDVLWRNISCLQSTYTSTLKLKIATTAYTLSQILYLWSQIERMLKRMAICVRTFYRLNHSLIQPKECCPEKETLDLVFIC